MNVEQWNISNIHSKRICDSAAAAYVMTRYGFSTCIIRCTTLLHTKSIAKIRQHHVALGGKDTYKKYGRKITPHSILKDPETFYSYNELMILYLRFHRSDPSIFLDVEAILRAWTLYSQHIENKEQILEKIDINSLWFLCRYLNALCVKCEDTDGGMIIYSDRDKAYYYHAHRSSHAVNYSGYINMRSLKDIEKSMTAKLKEVG